MVTAIVSVRAGVQILRQRLEGLVVYFPHFQYNKKWANSGLLA
jgi:hypothetical protein